MTAAYVGFVAACDAANTLDAAVAVSKADLKMTRTRFEQGTAPRADVLQAQAQYAERELRRSTRTAMRRLRTID